jgi:hypothetical protein
MQHVPYLRPTNIRRHHTEFRRPGKLVPGNFASLMCDISQAQACLMLGALLGQTKAYLLFTIAVACLVNVFNSTDNPHLECEQICSFS